MLELTHLLLGSETARLSEALNFIKEARAAISDERDRIETAPRGG